MMRFAVVSAAFFVAWSQAASQFSDADLRSALISMSRENRCGAYLEHPTDIRQCPTYSVALSGDGTVTYEGRLGVKTIGKRKHQIKVEDFQKLVVEFERAGFFSLRDRYDSTDRGNGVTEVIDHAIATTVTLSIAGKKKSVYDFYGTPDVVTQLERRVDEVSESRRYTGRPPNTALEPTALESSFGAPRSERAAAQRAR